MYTQSDINKQALEVMWRTDGYKLGHYAQFPKGTTKIYSNLTVLKICAFVAPAQDRAAG